MRTATASPDRVLGLLPEEQVLVGDDAAGWARGFRAQAVVFPATVDETQAVVCVANETGTRLLPAGRASWPGAGGWARAGQAVVVSTERMDEVHHYEPADLTLSAGAGLGWPELSRVLRPNGQWLAVDAPGVGIGTVGGAVACGVSGPLQGRYGAARDNVLGLEVVTGGGRILRIGGRVVKNVAGYDLVRLFTGSRGSLGVITSVSVRLFPRAESDVTLRFGGGAAEVVAMARSVCTSPLPVGAVEVDGGRAGADPMTLSVRVPGGPGEVDEVCSRLAACVGAEPRAVLRDGDSDAFHDDRMGWEADATVVVRLTALPDQLGRVLERARAIVAVMGGEISADALRGVVRVKGSPAPGRVAAVTEVLSRTRAAMEEGGGTLTLSDAPGEVAARVGWAGGGVDDGGLGARIKGLFDPNSILSAGCP